MIKLLAFMLLAACTQPRAEKTIGVYASSEYSDPTAAAMKIWNVFVGCKFLVPGTDVYVKAADGSPCGYSWRPSDEWDHAATAYACSEPQPGGHMTEVLVSYPGNVWSQTWTIAHEIGHRLKAEHHRSGVMGPTPDPNDPTTRMIRIRDVDSKRLNRLFCQ